MAPAAVVNSLLVGALIWCGNFVVDPCLYVRFCVLYSYAIILQRKVYLLCCGCLCLMYLLHSSVDWFVAIDCGISWSISLVF